MKIVGRGLSPPTGGTLRLLPEAPCSLSRCGSPARGSVLAPPGGGLARISADRVVIGAPSVVVIDGRIASVHEDPEEARAWIRPDTVQLLSRGYAGGG